MIQLGIKEPLLFILNLPLSNINVVCVLSSQIVNGNYSWDICIHDYNSNLFE